MTDRQLAWVARHPRPATDPVLTVYTVPPVGAGAGVHRAIADAVAADIEVVTLRLPGREVRRGEPPLDSLTALVDDLADRVRRHAAGHGTPYVVLGDCALSLLAFELARRLERGDGPAPVALLTLMGRSPGHGYPDDERRLASAEELRAEMARSGAVPPEITRDRAVFAMFEPVVRADLAACTTYRWDGEPLTDVPVVALVPADRMSDPGFTSWREATLAPLRLVPVGVAGQAVARATGAVAPPPELARELAELRDRYGHRGAPAGPDDTAARPGDTADRPGDAAAPDAPGTGHRSLAEQIGSLWTGLLPEARGDADEHFFDVGGDSMAAVRLHNRLRDRFGVAPPLEQLRPR